MIIQNKYEIGEEVYLKTDPGQSKRIIAELVITRNEVLYNIMLGELMTNHYEFELTKEKQLIIEDE